ncbi:MAG: hypothetical protein F6K54_17530 [Okeania sp. SIO3B5]|uniref:caspase family protein n=1 Tax=Okeania sp. SIO3B5 TaxID=2607811 RepID=UPI0013FF8067|nr:caspase family protein [Okeania sp. SIO3B5]NEO54721.1 hypothetical protein [Okeania sp. SIO3B5]
MAKYALLIGVSDYGNGYPRLLTPLNDIQALRKVLLDPDKGGFDEVKTLPNPDAVEMEDAIDNLFQGKTKDDITLLYFSCHGIRERGEFYFATRATRNNEQGNLLKSTALSASTVHSIMSSSSLKKQVVILDCCFSATFADGLLAREKLQEKGRVILTSSTSTQPSFEQEGLPLSIYTHHLFEGINTGAADVDEDSVISIKNLHDYTAKKVKEAFPRMQPEIYSVQPELLEISVAKAPIRNPRLRYSREVKFLCPDGEFSTVTRAQLDVLREELGLSLEDATVIEDEILRPIQQYKRNLQIFEDYLREEINRELSE